MALHKSEYMYNILSKETILEINSKHL